MKQYNNIAFTFPGQGSQSLGMLSELAESHSEIKETFRTASEVLGLDLWQMHSNGSPEIINQTENTQPLMLSAGVAVWRVWCKISPIRPGWMAGHSLGEFTALVCANSLTFEDAIAMVRERARLMQQAVPEGAGAMAAIIGLEDPQVVAICREVGENGIVAPVNFNAPGQIVIAGEVDAVNQAIDAAKQAGARRAVILPVSVPSHCVLMQSAAEEFSSYIENIKVESPEVPVIHNVDVASHAAADVIRHVLAKQMYNPVRWSDGVKFMNEQGVSAFVECGPGKILSGLNKRIVKGCDVLPVNNNKTLATAVEFIQ